MMGCILVPVNKTQPCLLILEDCHRCTYYKGISYSTWWWENMQIININNKPHVVFKLYSFNNPNNELL